MQKTDAELIAEVEGLCVDKLYIRPNEFITICQRILPELARRLKAANERIEKLNAPPVDSKTRALNIAIDRHGKP